MENVEHQPQLNHKAIHGQLQLLRGYQNADKYFRCGQAIVYKTNAKPTKHHFGKVSIFQWNPWNGA